jgi:hypothetical protein
MQAAIKDVKEKFIEQRHCYKPLVFSHIMGCVWLRLFESFPQGEAGNFSGLLVTKLRINPKLMHRLDQYAEIVTEHLAEHLIELALYRSYCGQNPQISL